ncbi:uncharacterized protein [Clytia hemisphaerica]|uniref:ShKT domain-containing protein n=1 Tax=Clytia hemisphaerica TaxID=252671 RepID=A0A7M5VD30_9CNID
MKFAGFIFCLLVICANSVLMKDDQDFKILDEMENALSSKNSKTVIDTTLSFEDIDKMIYEQLTKEKTDKQEESSKAEGLKMVQQILNDELPQKNSQQDVQAVKEKRKADDIEYIAKLFKEVFDSQKKEDGQAVEKKEYGQAVEKQEDGVETVGKKEKEDEAVEEPVCEDELSTQDCYDLAYNGSCTDPKTSKQTLKVCKRSCRVCCADNEKSQTCKLLKTLRNPMSICQMANTHERLRITCTKTCQYCAKAMTEVPCIRSKYGCCWDGSIAQFHIGTMEDGCPACRDYGGEKFCKSFQPDCKERYTLKGEQIRALCPMTCQRCGVFKKCADNPRLQDTCGLLRNDGACQSMFNAMKYNCPKTCNICHKATIDCKDTRFGCCENGKTIAKDPSNSSCPECHDDITSPVAKHCKRLVAHRVCKTHSAFMRKYCGGSCKFCTK